MKVCITGGFFFWVLFFGRNIYLLWFLTMLITLGISNYVLWLWQLVSSAGIFIPKCKLYFLYASRFFHLGAYSTFWSHIWLHVSDLLFPFVVLPHGILNNLVCNCRFFCAIVPNMRSAWATRMADLLKPDGELITLMFPVVLNIYYAFLHKFWLCSSSMHYTVNG